MRASLTSVFLENGWSSAQSPGGTQGTWQVPAVESLIANAENTAKTVSSRPPDSEKRIPAKLRDPRSHFESLSSSHALSACRSLAAMSGPLGGHQGYMKTFGPAGRGKKRFVTKGFKWLGRKWTQEARECFWRCRALLPRLGSYVVIKYKIAPETFVEYEGKIVDKRVGSEDKESYVELKDALTLNSDGKVVHIDKMKRLTDSFIEAGCCLSMGEIPVVKRVRWC